jgi:hypothetical protein
LTELYAAYSRSVSEAQGEFVAEYQKLVNKLTGQLGGLAEDSARANPLPAYTAEVTEAVKSGNMAGVSEANRRLATHVHEMSGTFERRSDSAVREFTDEANALYEEARERYLKLASDYSEEVFARWKDMSADTVDLGTIGLVQHGLIVRAAAKSLAAAVA